MAKIFGILLIVLGVWVGMEIFTKGTDGAFGGMFAEALSPIEGASSEPKASPMARAGENMQKRMDQGAARAAGDFGDDSEDETVDEE